MKIKKMAEDMKEKRKELEEMSLEDEFKAIIVGMLEFNNQSIKALAYWGDKMMKKNDEKGITKETT